jgi:hypothetical protein
MQEFDGYKYKVSDLIIAAIDLEPFDLKVRDVFTNYQAPCDNSLTSFIAHCKQTFEADMDYPIILSPCNFILDGKHRLAKAILENRETIKAVRFETMPDCGEIVEE